MRTFTRSSLAVAALALLTAVPVGAQVAPGDVISKANADKVKDLVSPGMFWCVQHGWPMKIVETKPITWKRAYKEATEKYASQVKLGDDGNGLSNYVAGQPFPKVETSDKFVANKLMWNFNFRPGFEDDLDKVRLTE